MRTVVFDQSLLETEVKPQPLLEEYRLLLSREVREILSDPEKLQDSPCPGCLSENSEKAFEKFGLTYRRCRECESVFVSPRPSGKDLVDFYRYSESFRFWRQRIFKETESARRVKVFRPRVRWLLDVVDEYRPEPDKALVAGYHGDLLLDELYQVDKNFCPVVVTNPLADLEYEGRDLPNVTIAPSMLKDVPANGPVDIFLAFDLLDRCQNLDGWFDAAKKTLVPGGLLLANTTLITGFDLQVLWDRAEGVYPPERMNLLSTEGMKILFERHGFETLEFSTPGTFDVDSVRRVIQASPDAGWPRFIRHMLMNRDKQTMHEFQEFLQKNRLSSFGRIVLRLAG